MTFELRDTVADELVKGEKVESHLDKKTELKYQVPGGDLHR